MSERMNRGDTVLLRATYEDESDLGTWAWLTTDQEDVSFLARRSQLTTEMAIRADERRRMVSTMRSEAARMRNRDEGVDVAVAAHFEILADSFEREGCAG